MSWVSVMARLSRRRIKTHRAADVTTVGAAEVEPERGGLTPPQIRTIWASVERLYETGLYPAIGLCLRRRGHVVMDRAIGHATGNEPGTHNGHQSTLATPDTLFNLFSASKAITAMVVHWLEDRRLIHLDDPVVEYIPEFGSHGKDSITIRQILTHTAGIPSVPGEEMDLDLLVNPAAIIERLAQSRPVWPPGRRLAYHALTGGFVLGEVVQRVTGKDIRQVLTQDILGGLGGFSTMSYGITPDLLPRVASNVATGPTPRFPLSWAIRRALGVPFEAAVELSNDLRFLKAIVPAGNIHCTANEASRFYQLMLNGGELDGVRVFQSRTIRRAVAEQIYFELDLTLGMPIRYGTGFILGSDRLSLYGFNTPKAFGHVGFTNVVTYADPERQLSVGLMTSGKPFASWGVLLWLDVMRIIARECPRDNRQPRD